MKQTNENNQPLPGYCVRALFKCLLKNEALYKMPIPLSAEWSSVPGNDIELEKRLKEIPSVLRPTSGKNILYFLYLMLNEERYEDADLPAVTNGCIHRYCYGGRFDAFIEEASLKLLMIEKHLRFVQNAVDAYRVIHSTYEQIPLKTHITQSEAFEELVDSLVLYQINHSISDSEEDYEFIDKLSQEAELLLSLPAFAANPEEAFLNFLDEEKIPLKELKRNYPNYRSAFDAHSVFLNAVQTYSYAFFLNNFTYDTKETAAMFAHSSIEYIKYAVTKKNFNPYGLNTRAVLVEKIVAFKRHQLCSYRYEDIFSCDLANIGTRDFIGIYFPRTNSSYKESLININ
jgi:hypothetical protein